MSRARILALTVLAFLLGVIVTQPTEPHVPRPAVEIPIEPQAAPARFSPLLSAGSTLGFHWAQTVAVYDGTGQRAWKIPEAAAEWSARTGVTLAMTSDPSKANIYVTEATIPGNTAGALGVAYYPPSTSGIAYGTCQVQLRESLPANYPKTAEHTAIHELGHCLGLAHSDANRAVMEASVRLGDGFTKPQTSDYKTIRALYSGATP